NVNSFRGIGYNLLGQERNQEAIEVFKRWTQLSPNEANAFDSLADAYESVGKNDLALSAHLQAVSVAKRLKDPRFEFFTQMLNDFKARVAKKSS
ncbi:MAG: tetratricopeptide repeat protein, partial [Psychrobium sp.]